KDGFCSRLGVGPIETLGKYGKEKGLQQMLDTTAVHFDQGHQLNGWAWVTSCWEVAMVKTIGHTEMLGAWLQEVRRRWPLAKCLTQGEFGLLWRENHPDNSRLDYRFIQRGTGLGGSDRNLEIRWFMNKEFRLALLRDWADNGPERVID